MKLAIKIFLITLTLTLSFSLVHFLNTSENKEILNNIEHSKTYAQKTYNNRLKLENAYKQINSQIPGIVLIGSDLMQSTGATNLKFASELQNKLYENNYKINITNLSVKGENILTILGRIGVIPFKINKDVTIPAEPKLVEIDIVSIENDAPVYPLAVISNNANFNPVSIDNLVGKIGGDNVINPLTGKNKHYFLRSKKGKDFTIKKGALIQTNSDDEYKNYSHIIWLGENDTQIDYQNLSNYIQKIVNSLENNHNRYLILGLTTGDNNSMAEYDKLMETNFGTHYINIRKYLSEFDLSNSNINYTESNLYEQKQGKIPSCFLNEENKTLLNDIGYKTVLDYVYQGLVNNNCVLKP